METPHPNTNNFDQLQPTPGVAPDLSAQQGVERPEVIGDTAPTDALHALGGTAVGHGDFVSSSIGGLKLGESFTWGTYDEDQGKNVINTTTFRGLDTNRNPIFTTTPQEAKPTNQTAALAEETSGTEVMESPRPSVAVHPPESDPMAGLTTSQKMAQVEAALRERGMVDEPMVSKDAAAEEATPQAQPTPQPERTSRSPQEDDEDFSAFTYTSSPADTNRAARAAAAERQQQPIPERAEPGARAAAEAAKALQGEEFAVDDGIPRAAEPEDLHTSGPRLDRRPIQYE